MSWKPTEKLMSTISHYAGFPATGVSLRQMVQFGEKPSTGEECDGMKHTRLIYRNQEHSSGRRSSSQKNFLSASLTVSKNWQICRMA